MINVPLKDYNPLKEIKPNLAISFTLNICFKTFWKSLILMNHITAFIIVL